MTETILEIKNLKKSYGKNEVLKDISLSVKKGEVISIIGSSGSGKSTFLRSINLLESPSGGEILYHGDNVLEKGYDLTTYRERLGMVFQSFNLFENLNVLENAIVAQTTVLKRDRKEAESIAKANLEKVGMGEQYWKAKPKQLSGGQKRLLAFVLCLIGKPDILFLDEPTIGLDVSVKDNIRRAITQINQEEETTILLTTHDLSDIEQLCDRIFMIDKGQEIFDGTVSQLKETFGKMKTLSFDLTPGQNHLVSHYEGLPDMSIDRQGNTLNIEFDSSRYQSADIIKQTLSDFEVRDLKMVDTDIEDIIRRFYRKEL